MKEVRQLINLIKDQSTKLTTVINKQEEKLITSLPTLTPSQSIKTFKIVSESSTERLECLMKYGKFNV